MNGSISRSTEQKKSTVLEEQTFAVSKFRSALLSSVHYFYIHARLTTSCKGFQTSQYLLTEQTFISDQNFGRVCLAVNMEQLHLLL